MGWGRILFSDGSSYSVRFPSQVSGVDIYPVSPTGPVSWMRLISDRAGSGDPGFTEVEAYATEDYGYIHNIIGRQHAVPMNGLTYGGFSEPSEGTSLTLNSKRIIWKPGTTTVSETRALTIPGTLQEASANVISEYMWLNAGDKVVVNVTQSFSSGNIGMYQQGEVNLWYSGDYEVPTAGKQYSFTALDSGTYFLYSWTYNGSKTGAGTYTIVRNIVPETQIPVLRGQVVTLEFWMYCTGTEGQMPFFWGDDTGSLLSGGYDNLYFGAGKFGFNTGANWYF